MTFWSVSLSSLPDISLSLTNISCIWPWQMAVTPLTVLPSISQLKIVYVFLSCCYFVNNLRVFSVLESSPLSYTKPVCDEDSGKKDQELSWICPLLPVTQARQALTYPPWVPLTHMSVLALKGTDKTSEEPFWIWWLEICPNYQCMFIVENLGNTGNYELKNNNDP